MNHLSNLLFNYMRKLIIDFDTALLAIKASSYFVKGGYINDNDYNRINEIVAKYIPFPDIPVLPEEETETVDQ